MESQCVAVFGAGYVGLVTAAALAKLGNDVRLYDPDEAKLALARAGRAAFYEPGLDDLLADVVGEGRLHVCTSPATALTDVEIVFIAVGTPSRDDGRPDLRAVRAATETIADHLARPAIIVNKSTVPVETADFVETIVRNRRSDLRVTVVSNPEFLREGSALADFFAPDRIVLGCEDETARVALERLYAPLAARTIVTDRHTAELIKYAANAFLATKISFVNEIASICERTGGDITALIAGIGSDARIGSAYLEPGLGFGGSCLPKDVRALCATAGRVATEPALLGSVLAVNTAQIERIASRIAYVLEGLAERRVAVLGLAFKPETDDVRESPALALVRNLAQRGATIAAHDPVAHATASAALAMFTRESVEVVANIDDCIRGADAIVLATAWPQYRTIDPRRVADLVRRRVIFDTRGALDAAAFCAAGFHYSAVGSASRRYPLADIAFA